MNFTAFGLSFILYFFIDSLLKGGFKVVCKWNGGCDVVWKLMGCVLEACSRFRRRGVSDKNGFFVGKPCKI